jgi:hypothetical protein
MTLTNTPVEGSRGYDVADFHLEEYRQKQGTEETAPRKASLVGDRRDEAFDRMERNVDRPSS